MQLRTILIILSLSCWGMISAQSMQHPPFLQQGDTVAILSPSYNGLGGVEIEENTLRSWGYVPVRTPNFNATYKTKLAGTKAQRKSDLLWALTNPSVKAIFCSRGGYGSIHLLDDDIPVQTYHDYPKWIIGYSDITSLLTAEVAAGVMSIHGAMSGTFSSHANDTICTFVRDMLRGQDLQYFLPGSNSQNITGQASGRLIGGNFCTFYPLVGTDFDPTLVNDGNDGYILFLEEIGENFHTIDRMVNMLRLHGFLERINGVILGDWASCSADLTYSSADEMLRGYFQPLGIPVCCGFHAGHLGVNLPLMMGAFVQMNVTNSGATISFSSQNEQEDGLYQIDANLPYKVFDLMGRYMGTEYPAEQGVYILQQQGHSVVTVVH